MKYENKTHLNCDQQHVDRQKVMFPLTHLYVN